MLEKFGTEARKWFSRGALEAAKDLKYDGTTKKVIDHSKNSLDLIIPSIGTNKLSRAQRQKCITDRMPIEDIEALQLEEEKDEDTDDEEEEDGCEFGDKNRDFEDNYQFELDALFQMEPTIFTGPHQDDGSIFTNATASTANTISNILPEDQEPSVQKTGEEKQDE